MQPCTFFSFLVFPRLISKMQPRAETVVCLQKVQRMELYMKAGACSPY